MLCDILFLHHIIIILAQCIANSVIVCHTMTWIYIHVAGPGTGSAAGQPINQCLTGFGMPSRSVISILITLYTPPLLLYHLLVSLLIYHVINSRVRTRTHIFFCTPSVNVWW